MGSLKQTMGRITKINSITIELILPAVVTENKSTHEGYPISINLPTNTMHYFLLNLYTSIKRNFIITLHKTFHIP
jgi:hypothetical protein